VCACIMCWAVQINFNNLFWGFHKKLKNILDFYKKKLRSFSLKKNLQKNPYFRLTVTVDVAFQ